MSDLHRQIEQVKSHWQSFAERLEALERYIAQGKQHGFKVDADLSELVALFERVAAEDFGPGMVFPRYAREEVAARRGSASDEPRTRQKTEDKLVDAITAHGEPVDLAWIEDQRIDARVKDWSVKVDELVRDGRLVRRGRTITVP